MICRWPGRRIWPGRTGRRRLAAGLMLAGYRLVDRAGVADTGLVQRISVVGNSGSGKTTLARGIAAALSIPHLELDSVFHQPGWQPLDTEEFRRAVAAFTAGESWV